MLQRYTVSGRQTTLVDGFRENVTPVNAAKPAAGHSRVRTSTPYTGVIEEDDREREEMPAALPFHFVLPYQDVSVNSSATFPKKEIDVVALDADSSFWLNEIHSPQGVVGVALAIAFLAGLWSYYSTPLSLVKDDLVRYTTSFCEFDQSLELVSQEMQADYVLVFPLRGRKTSNLHCSGTRMMQLKWEDIVHGRDLARAIFMDPSKVLAVTDEQLDSLFQEEMTFEKYADAVCALLMEIFNSERFGLELEAFPSVDHDEVYLKMRLPNLEAVRQMAAHQQYLIPLSNKAYKKAGIDVPVNCYRQEVRCFAPFLPNQEELFTSFKSLDRVRMIRARIDKFIDLGELMFQNILAEAFVPHQIDEAQHLAADWGNPLLWYRLPSHKCEDRVRNYFGEELAWLFLWQGYFMRSLILPSFVGGVIFLRHVFFHEQVQRNLQLAFAVFMSLWATIMNAMYQRYQARACQRWGMDKFETAVSVRNEYMPDRDGSWRVWVAMGSGDILAIVFIILSVVGLRFIQGWREHMLVNHSSQVWHHCAAILLSLQILTLDKLWQYVARLLVDCENQKTRSSWNSSMVEKMFLVRIFNNLYPFLYIGFLKKYSYQGCPKTEAGCIDELARSLLTYFIVRLVIRIGGDFLLLVYSRVQVAHELFKDSAGERHSMYLQVQAKSADYDEVMWMDDWTELIITFLFIVCFNVVLPAIAVLALITTMLEARFLAFRNCSYLRRPISIGADGIGAYQHVLEVVEVVGVLINVCFAVFTLKPLKDYDTTSKFVIFVCAEHAMLMLKLLVKVKLPSKPRDVEDIEQVSESVIRRVFVDQAVHPIKMPAVQTEGPPYVGPRAFGGRL